MVNNVRKNYEGFTSTEIKRADAAYKALGHIGNPTVEDFDKWYVLTRSKTFLLLLKT